MAHLTGSSFPAVWPSHSGLTSQSSHIEPFLGYIQAQMALLRASQILGKSIDLAEAALVEGREIGADNRDAAASAPGSVGDRPLLSYENAGFLTQRYTPAGKRKALPLLI